MIHLKESIIFLEIKLYDNRIDFFLHHIIFE